MQFREHIATASHTVGQEREQEQEQGHIELEWSVETVRVISGLRDQVAHAHWVGMGVTAPEVAYRLPFVVSDSIWLLSTCVAPPIPGLGDIRPHGNFYKATRPGPDFDVISNSDPRLRYIS